MSKHLHTGREGEALAAGHLQENGYTILHQNWRHSHWEIDLIVTKDKCLHFIEVKTRRTKKFGYPEEAVTKKKFKHLQEAATEFLYQYPQWERIQFDILSISIGKDSKIEYFLIEDVFL
ncbi:MAG: YraN family protein [Chitinophagaceae bacterium]